MKHLLLLFVFFFYAGVNGVRPVLLTKSISTIIKDGKVYITSNKKHYELERIFFSAFKAMRYYRRQHD